MTTALATINGHHATALMTDGHNPYAFEPNNLPEAIKLAEVLWASGLLPRHLNKPQAVVAAIVMGRELGLSAMQSVRGIHVIEGKPALSADLMVALVKKSPACLYFRMVSSDATAAVYETQRKGDPEPTRMSFTMDEANAAGVTGKDNWRKYGPAMLRARCSSALARAVYPDLVMGIYDPDELEREPAAPTYRIEPDRTVNTETGEVVTGEVVEADPLAAFGGQDNQPPQPKPYDLEGARTAFLAQTTNIAKANGYTGAQCLTARKELMREIVGTDSTKRCFEEEMRRLLWHMERNASLFLAKLEATKPLMVEPTTDDKHAGVVVLPADDFDPMQAAIDAGRSASQPD